MTANYSEEDEKYMTEKYALHPTPETIELLAFDLGKSPRSIISKLARLGVYKSRGSYKPKYGDAPVTKEDLVASVASLLDLEVSALSGLESSKKDSLLTLEKRIKERLP